MCMFVCLPKKKKRLKCLLLGILNIHIKFEIERDIKNIRNILFFSRAMFTNEDRKKSHTKLPFYCVYFFLIFLFHRSLFFMSMLVYGGTHKKELFVSLLLLTSSCITEYWVGLLSFLQIKNDVTMSYI